MEYPVSCGKVQFDLDALLKPISEESPCGESLAYEGAYDRIREERRQDDELERGIYQARLKKADWPAVERICTESLQNRSKDLYLAAWLLEAWIHRYGFSGVRAGFQLLSGLCRQFGFVLYPRAEAGELDTLLAPVEWINGKIPPQLKLIPITKPEAGDTPGYNWADYEATTRTGGARKTPGGPAQAEFQRSATLTGDRFLRELREEVHGALGECTRFAEVMADVYGPGTPALGQLTGVLQPLSTYLTNALDERGGGISEVPVAESVRDPPDPVMNMPAAPAMSGTGRIRSRVEAYRRLAEAADFLADTEPHSPVPYLVRRAIYWGNMRLEELLPELVQNQGDLGEIRRLLQISACGDRKRSARDEG